MSCIFILGNPSSWHWLECEFIYLLLLVIFSVAFVNYQINLCIITVYSLPAHHFYFILQWSNHHWGIVPFISMVIIKALEFHCRKNTWKQKLLSNINIYTLGNSWKVQQRDFSETVRYTAAILPLTRIPADFYWRYLGSQGSFDNLKVFEIWIVYCVKTTVKLTLSIFCLPDCNVFNAVRSQKHTTQMRNNQLLASAYLISL